MDPDALRALAELVGQFDAATLEQLAELLSRACPASVGLPPPPPPPPPAP